MEPGAERREENTPEEAKRAENTGTSEPQHKLQLCRPAAEEKGGEVSSPSLAQPPTSADETDFKAWMIEHNKTYSTNEYYKRLQIFTENKRMIDEHNAGNHSNTLGLNQFADMSLSEFQKIC